VGVRLEFALLFALPPLLVGARLVRRHFAGRVGGP